MEENKNQEMIEEQPREYITEQEARTVKQLFVKYLKSYKEKDATISDREWLEQLFQTELPEISLEEVKRDAEDLVNAIENFDKNLDSINQSAKQGISKESWLASKIQEASVGMAVSEYGQVLQSMDNMLYQKNMELADAIKRSSDGHIMMSPNLDGNLAEHMIAKTTQLSADIQGKNIKVDVLESHNRNSVDVRITNLETGKYQNYQLKFGKDAKATIALIERGNYNNQRIIVPTDQLEEVRAYFEEKGSNKTITDHIEAWGVEGKKFTKNDMKTMQLMAQEDGIMPSMDYSHYQTKELAMSIGKNASAMAIQSAAITTGLNIAAKIFNGERIDADEMVTIAVKTGADTSVKVVTAGTLQVAVRKGIIRCIPKMTPAGVIANIACVAVENVKILSKIASGDVSITKGLDQMGRTTTSMVGGLWGMAKGASLAVGLATLLPIAGPAVAVVSGFVGGMVGYCGGSTLGNMVYSAGKAIAGVAKSVAKTVVSGLRSVGESIVSGVRSIGIGLLSFLGF